MVSFSHGTHPQMVENSGSEAIPDRPTVGMGYPWLLVHIDARHITRLHHSGDMWSLYDQMSWLIMVASSDFGGTHGGQAHVDP